MSLKKIITVALALLVAGCAGPQTQELLGSAIVAAPVTDIAGNHSIFIATTRKRSDDPNKVFDGERSATLNYARVNVTVPPVHETGQIERRSRGKSDDPTKYFMASELVGYDTQPKFASALNADIAARGGRVMAGASLMPSPTNSVFARAVSCRTIRTFSSGEVSA